MHELAVTQGIVEIVCESAGAAQVSRVVVEIGRLSGVLPDAVRFCFDLCAEGTVLEGAALEIVEPPGRGRCRACGRVQEMTNFFDACACGAIGLDCVAGDELRVKEMELA